MTTPNENAEITQADREAAETVWDRIEHTAFDECIEMEKIAQALANARRDGGDEHLQLNAALNQKAYDTGRQAGYAEGLEAAAELCDDPNGYDFTSNPSIVEDIRGAIQITGDAIRSLMTSDGKDGG